MKHTKMSKRIPQEADRAEVEQLEQQRIDFEHRSRLARENLYGHTQVENRGWVDHKIQ